MINTKRNYKHIILSSIIVFVLISTMIPVDFVLSKKIDTPTKNSTNLEKTSQDSNEETKFYAVIAACSKYMVRKNNLPTSKWHLNALNRSLSKSENNWAIKCLINEQGTKENILNALDWAENNVGENDVFLFSWQGHGSEVPDEDGDELRIGFLDKYDEVICPYDCYRDKNETLHNYITDDTLGEKFNSIEKNNPKGMLLIFESCLSGGLVERKAMAEIDKNQDLLIDQEEAELYNDVIYQDFSDPKKTLGDISGSKRIIIVSTPSTLRNTLGRGTWIFGFTMTWTMAHALKKGLYGPARDRNKDGWISATEAFDWTCPRTKLSNLLYWMFSWSYIFRILYGIEKDENSTNPFGAALNATLYIMATYVILQVYSLIKNKHFMFNWPPLINQMDEEIPLVKLKKLF